MSTHSEEQFNRFISQLKETNATLEFFCDFNKITQHVTDISISLNTLNYLLGKEDMRHAVEALWERDKTVFNVLDILIAVRKKDRKKVIDSLGNPVWMENFFTSVEGVIEFLNHTGLAKVFQQRQITNLEDYVFGIETGLDSNARKNRSGQIMEESIHKLLNNNNIHHRMEVYSREFPDLKGLGEDEKRFDFVVKTKKKKYLIEVNFYSSGGSKLNEVARSYSELAPKINANPNFEFVWITDGMGWLSAKNKLQEAYYIIPSIYNLTNIIDFIQKVKSEDVPE